MIEPIVGTLVFHDLQYSTSINFPDVLVMQMLIEGRTESLIFFFPPKLILIKSEGISEDLFAEGALIFKMLFSDSLLMLFEILILDLILIANWLEMYFFSGLSKRLFIVEER